MVNTMIFRRVRFNRSACHRYRFDRTGRFVLLVGLIMVVGLAGGAGAQPDDAGEDGQTPLGVRQENVRRMITEMRDRFLQLAQTLARTEPEQAERLTQAIREASEALIEQRAAEIADMLNRGQLDAAAAAQQQVIGELKRLIDLLTRDSELDEMLEEMRRLERWRQQVAQLIQREAGHLNETQNLTQKDKALANLDAQIAALKALIDKQAGVVDQIGQARQEGLRALDRAADAQRAVRQQTEALGRAMQGAPSESGASDAQDQPAEASDAQSGEAQPGEAQPGEAGSAGEPGSQSQPSESSGGQTESSSDQSGQSGQPGESGESGQSGQPSSAEQAAGPPTPGQQQVQRAADHQQQAEQQLAGGKSGQGQDQANAALEELRVALDRLEAERRRIERLPPEHMDQIAGDQDRTAEQAGDLADEMSQAPPGSSGQSGQPGQSGQSGESGQSGQSQPGQQQVQNAQQQMQQASRQLRKRQGESAGESEQQAIDELSKAQQAIEDRLAQLREQMQEELLAALEARFVQMLERQKPVTLATADLDEMRHNRDTSGSTDADDRKPAPLTRPQAILVAQMAEEEAALAEMAAQALDVIREDGTTLVFPKIVEQLRQDLQTTEQLLGEQNTGAYTQDLQQQIERTLRELIEALQRAQEVSQQQSQPGQQQQQESDQLPPLVPDSAELKLLKSAQLRVNQRTERFDQLRESRPAVPQPLRNEPGRIARMQESVRQLAEELSLYRQ